MNLQVPIKIKNSSSFNVIFQALKPILARFMAHFQAIFFQISWPQNPPKPQAATFRQASLCLRHLRPGLRARRRRGQRCHGRRGRWGGGQRTFDQQRGLQRQWHAGGAPPQQGMRRCKLYIYIIYINIYIYR